jgi:cobalt-zinc-cadmium efflux system protein
VKGYFVTGEVFVAASSGHDGHDHDHPGHDHTGHSHAGHDRSGHDHSHGVTDKKRVLVVAVLTGGFMVAEAIGGVVTGSLALLADAGHMLTDSIALWLAWYAFHLAERPATRRLTYGLGRVKTLVAYTNGITIFAVAIWIVYEAARRFIEPEPILGGPMLVVASLGLLVNIVGFLVLHGGDRKSLNMRGALLHVLGDMLGSVAAIVAALIILATGWTPIDPILSVLVAVLILSTAWSLMREAAHVLLEGVPDSLDRDGIARDIEDNIAGVREVHHMHVWSIDGEKNMATLHACLTEGADAFAAVTAIKARLAGRHGIEHATVEPEFGACTDRQAEHLH